MLSRLFFGGTGQVPIDRSGGKASEAALTTGLRILGKGELLALYPRARGPTTGSSTAAVPGAARMALHAEVPVIPWR